MRVLRLLTCDARMFCYPAPSLHHLEIVVSSSPDAGGKERIRLPEDFLGQRVPELRSVLLLGVSLVFVSQVPLGYNFAQSGMGSASIPARYSGFYPSHLS